MKKLFFGLIWLFILLVCSIESFSFTCNIDGTCFSQCVDKDNLEIDYCKIKCTTCGW